MRLSDVQIHEFMILWKKATGEDIPGEQARQLAARLIHLYRVLVHRIPSDRALTATGLRPGLRNPVAFG